MINLPKHTCHTFSEQSLTSNIFLLLVQSCLYRVLIFPGQCPSGFSQLGSCQCAAPCWSSLSSVILAWMQVWSPFTSSSSHWSCCFSSPPSLSAPEQKSLKKVVFEGCFPPGTSPITIQHGRAIFFSKLLVWSFHFPSTVFNRFLAA